MADEVYVERDNPEDIRLADDLADELHDRTDVRAAKSRHDFARLAANISEDRYSAGSQAALVTLICYLRFGYAAAYNFTKDLQHHES